MKKLLTLLLALGLLGSTIPVLAAEEVQAEPIPAWAYGEVADIYAMGLVGDEIYTDHSKPVTQEQLDKMTKVAADKLVLLEVEQRSNAGSFVIDTTRGGVLNALYMEALPYAFAGIDAGPVEFLSSLGVIHGSGSDLALDRPCTLLEAACFAERMILALYDQQNAGSLGLLWKAEGNGNTLYLLGSIHTDRNNLYPFHKQLRDIITGAELAAFELDFNNQEGIDEFTAMQMYSDGTTLKDHIDPELYQEVVEALAPLGMPEEQIANYKPWALANTFTALSMTDDTSSENAMALDLYVSAKASNLGIQVEGIETYAFQGKIFDDLSNEYQENYLAMTLSMYLGMDAAEGLSEEEKAAYEAALKEQDEAVSRWMEQWKTRDTEAFANDYPKDVIQSNTTDELNSKLFEGRDPNMIAWADRYLKQEGSHTGIMTVGAGHMIGKTGIVQGLKDLGYTVEVVPAP
ncbi:TraB/GumN family protein [Flintibacter muris]|uniref:TraB/GumN family protein n=1 Tax=Flintibacter muris TaxID=2941327 RepID=UPI00203DFC16|nr:TraB/GumN family protein [Flintibacter muris]